MAGWSWQRTYQLKNQTLIAQFSFIKAEGIYLCHTEKEYINLIEFVDAVHNEKTLIAQEYLGDRPGEDLRVFVVGDKVIGAMKRTAPEGDFRANITHGGTGEQYVVSKEIEEIALIIRNFYIKTT